MNARRQAAKFVKGWDHLLENRKCRNFDVIS
jgi:hypothetical protein